MSDTPTIFNDDYCDLADGSDEVSTSACSYLNVKFTCLGRGCKSVEMPTSRMNDGVCDCFDGTDEWDKQYTSAVCPNRCPATGPVGALSSPALSNHTISAAISAFKGNNLRSAFDPGRHVVFLPVQGSLRESIYFEVSAQILVLFVLIVGCASFVYCKVSKQKRIVRGTGSSSQK